MDPVLFAKAKEFYESNQSWAFGWHTFEEWCEENGIDPDEWFDEYRERVRAGEFPDPTAAHSG